MRKKREVQRFLEQAEKLHLMILNKSQEKAMFKQVAQSITTRTDGERVQASGSQSRMADAVIEYVDVEAEIDDMSDKLCGELQKIIRFIEKIENPTFYNILHMRYIQFKGFDEIGMRYGKDYNWATTNHGRALVCAEEIFQKEKHH